MITADDLIDRQSSKVIAVAPAAVLVSTSINDRRESMNSSYHDCNVSYGESVLESIPQLTDEDVPRSGSMVSNYGKTVQHELLRDRVRKQLQLRNDKAMDHALNAYT